MKFIGEFVNEIEAKRSGLYSLFGLDERAGEIESALREQLDRRWHGLPAPGEAFDTEFSVDSSSASRSLCNGVDFFIIRALMLGTGDYSRKSMQFEMVKGIRDSRVAVDFERILRDLIEITIVRDNLGDVPDGAAVLIDGNLYGRFTHLLRQLNLRGWEHLPLTLLDAMQRLFEDCVDRGITLVGVSKFSKTRVLTTALLAERGYRLADPDYLDVELLYRWRQGETGYTTPLMLGEYAIEKEALSGRDPRDYVSRYFPSIPQSRRGWAERVIDGVPSSPAVVMFHIIPKENAQPMRVDIPACSLGVTKKISDVKPFEFTDPGLVEQVARQLVSDFGGRDVYNALLYIVDREVRLGVSTVDRVYRSVLGRELGVPIEYDRSTRRFTY
ncbi:MAG TPA: DNA double-strand break repair nuclease NurA [Candidatus Krumholzibacteriaceae bacterium]|nr:DNA double-strand break repair nuclease NurA [Candidatus Krumholzibacteriaceae bacterium]